MKANYKVRNGLFWKGQKYFILSNYPPLNEIVVYGFDDYLPNRNKYDVGCWKIKKLKN